MRTLPRLPIAASLLVALCWTPVGAQAPKPAQTPKPAPAPAQSGQRPPARPPRPTAPPAKPATPAPAPAAVVPPKPVVQDLHLKGVYTTGDQRTESVTYVKGPRQRFEFGDMVVLQQPDLQRTVQISKAANTYLIVPQSAPPAGAAPAVTPPVAGVPPPPAKPGV